MKFALLLLFCTYMILEYAEAAGQKSDFTPCKKKDDCTETKAQRCESAVVTKLGNCYDKGLCKCYDSNGQGVKPKGDGVSVISCIMY